MGIVLIVLGLAAAAVVGDFVFENDLDTPDQAYLLFGRTFELSTPELVLVAAVLGALAVSLVLLGIGLLRGSWGRRRALKQQMAELQRENTELRTKANLAKAVEG